MDLIQSIFMGFVQGLSEFLPISSSAHLVFASGLYKFFTGNVVNVETGEEIFFNMMLHIGTLFAIFVFFKKEILDIIKALWIAIKTKSLENKDAKLGLYIILATFFTVLVAHPLKDFAEYLVYSPAIVGVLLIFTGIYLLLSEFVSKKIEEKPVTLKSSIIMGIAQGLAAFPGFSRSGLTIATGLFAGLNRVDCARFSFLLSIPIILGTSILYPVLELNMKDVVNYNWLSIAVGTIVSAIVGYYCIKYFLAFLAKFSLGFFAYYCIIAGAFFAVFFKFFA